MKNRRMGILVILFLTTVSAAAVSILPKMPQDPAYNNFADSRNAGGIPNAANALSNAAFILVGLYGLRALTAKGCIFAERAERWIYIALYLGVILTGIGSGYYHLWPDNDRLVWDRLPMTILFGSLVSSIISERISPRAGLLLLPLFLAAGMGSVIYWGLSERAGTGDLRLYCFVHFYPLLLIPVIMCLFPNRYTRSRDLLWVLGFYGLATVAEALDKPIFDILHLVSGHTVKHLLAAAAVYSHVRMVSTRQVHDTAAHARVSENESTHSSDHPGCRPVDALMKEYG